MKFLIFGDIFGKPGREALERIMPKWRKKFKPDCVIANGENLSHGKGISQETFSQITRAGVGIVTGGNHILEGKDGRALLENADLPLIRPINFLENLPGKGFLRSKVGKIEILVINAIAQGHMKHHYNSPYEKIEKLLAENEAEAKTKIIIVDWHAETTSEKKALGVWLDGKVSLVYGTHTHTPTADEQILPGGAAFISDVGMTGPYHSIIGEDSARRLEIMIRQAPAKPDVAAAPPYEANAISVEIDSRTGQAVKIERLREIFG